MKDPTRSMSNHALPVIALSMVCALFAPVAAQAATYYVATTGSDTNAGSATAPFKTIQKAVAAVKAGDTVLVKAGTYTVTQGPAQFIGIYSNKSGTSTARIRFKSETLWGAKIKSVGVNISWLNAGSYVDIEGFDVTGDNAAYNGIVNQGAFGRILRNHVHHYVTPECSSNGGAGINNGGYSTNVGSEIIGNLVHDIGTTFVNKADGLASSSYCIRIHGIYHATKGGKVQNNIVYRSAGLGIHLYHAANNVVISHNLVFNNGAKTSTGHIGGGILIASGGSGFTTPISDTIVSNNIVRNNRGGSIREGVAGSDQNVGSGNKIVNNILFGNTSNTIVAPKAAVSDNKIGVDPQMMNFLINGGGNYRLKSTSPAINTGSTACVLGHSRCTPTTDIDGTARPQGTGYDIGPYEFKPTL